MSAIDSTEEIIASGFKTIFSKRLYLIQILIQFENKHYLIKTFKLKYIKKEQ